MGVIRRHPNMLLEFRLVSIAVQRPLPVRSVLPLVLQRTRSRGAQRNTQGREGRGIKAAADHFWLAFPFHLQAKPVRLRFLGLASQTYSVPLISTPSPPQLHLQLSALSSSSASFSSSAQLPPQPSSAPASFHFLVSPSIHPASAALPHVSEHEEVAVGPVPVLPEEARAGAQVHVLRGGREGDH